MKNNLFLLTVLAFLTLPINAQYVIERSVGANGGQAAANGSYRINGSAGQTLIGRSDGTNNLIAAGFWEGLYQTILNDSFPQLPFPICAATAEIWNGSIYLFGGGNHWLPWEYYQTIYRLDQNGWAFVDSLTDNGTWDAASVLVGDEVYLLAGHRNGSLLARKYDMVSGNITQLANSPNRTNYGTTSHHVNGLIYQINHLGFVFEYDIAADSWSAKTANNAAAYNAIRGVLYNDEIYVVGFQNREVYKYSTQSDTWTQLASTPYPVSGFGIEIHNGVIYCIGGSPNGLPQDLYKSIISYDIASDSWALDPREISDPRMYMATLIYDDDLLVIGGFDTTGYAVDIVERPFIPNIVGIDDPQEIPQNFDLKQNYPNPFNPTTVIGYSLSVDRFTTLTVYDILGRTVRTLVNERQQAGNYSVNWDGRNNSGRAVSSGIYFYRLQAGEFMRTRRMLMMK